MTAPDTRPETRAERFTYSLGDVVARITVGERNEWDFEHFMERWEPGRYDVVMRRASSESDAVEDMRQAAEKAWGYIQHLAGCPIGPCTCGAKNAKDRLRALTTEEEGDDG